MCGFLCNDSSDNNETLSKLSAEGSCLDGGAAWNLYRFLDAPVAEDLG